MLLQSGHKKLSDLKIFHSSFNFLSCIQFVICCGGDHQARCLNLVPQRGNLIPFSICLLIYCLFIFQYQNSLSFMFAWFYFCLGVICILSQQFQFCVLYVCLNQRTLVQFSHCLSYISNVTPVLVLLCSFLLSFYFMQINLIIMLFELYNQFSFL